MPPLCPFRSIVLQLDLQVIKAEFPVQFGLCELRGNLYSVKIFPRISAILPHFDQEWQMVSGREIHMPEQRILLSVAIALEVDRYVYRRSVQGFDVERDQRKRWVGSVCSY